MIKTTSIKDYKLSSLTMLILPQFDDFGNVYSKVIEENGEIIVMGRPRRIIQAACEYFGSNLSGRQKGTRAIAGFTNKVPIAIEPHSNIYFFPTGSPRVATSVWVSHSHVVKTNYIAHKQTEVVFNNGYQTILQISQGSLTNQLHRTAQLRFLIEQRVKDSKVDSEAPQLSRVADSKRYFQPFS